MYFDNEPINVNYIFYNNRLHDRGTRSEYRLTGITKFFKNLNMKEGDDLIFSYDNQKGIYILKIRHNGTDLNEDFDEDQPIIIHAGWSLQYK